MCDCFCTFQHSIGKPRLPGISAFGTRLAFYEYVSATTRLTLPVIVQQWTHDLLDANGATRILQVAQEVLAMCQAMGN